MVHEHKDMDVPTAEELEDFKSCVKLWMEIDNNIKKMQVMIKERNAVKREISSKILAFMARFNIEDLNTKEGKLRYKITTVKETLSQSKIKQKIEETYEPGINVNELTTRVFERNTTTKPTLKRFK